MDRKGAQEYSPFNPNLGQFAKLDAGIIGAKQIAGNVQFRRSDERWKS